MKDKPVLPPLPKSRFESIHDLLTDEEKAKLRDDLAKIAAMVRPCWTRPC